VDTLRAIRRVSQIRQYAPDPVGDDVIDQLLELARWTGSSKNTQPWNFIVVRDRDVLKKLSAMRPNINWAADAPVGIVIVLDGESPMSEAYDEGRLTERILTGATLLGHGGGVAWFGEEEHQNTAKQLLGIPAEKTIRQMILIGKPKSKDDPRPYGPKRGRKPIAELVSRERWGAKTAR
jgi:nitroreductase